MRTYFILFYFICHHFLLEKLYSNLETRAINTADTTPINVVSEVSSRQYRRRRSIDLNK